MNYRQLGRTDLRVSTLCLGSMTWGEQNSASQAFAQIERAKAYGINFIDTAEMYPVPPRKETQGATEAILGTWLGKNRGRRDKLVIASKIAGPGRREWIRGGDNHVSKRTVPWAIDDSLKRLQTDYIDLYQIHWPERYVPAFGAWQYDPSKEREAVPILEQVEAMGAAIRAGALAQAAESAAASRRAARATPFPRSRGEGRGEGRLTPARPTTPRGFLSRSV